MTTIKVYLRFITNPIKEWLIQFVTPQGDGKESSFDQLSHWSARIGLILALFVVIAAPFLALSWVKSPFPGFMVEQTSVINSLSSPSWGNEDLGISYPQRVTSINGAYINSSQKFIDQLAMYSTGDTVSIGVELPDQTTIIYPAVQLIQFETSDLLQLFWLPYGIAVVYLLTGLLIYRVRGDTRPGRAFAYMAAVSAIVIGFYFDLSSSHAGSVIWTIAIAQIGSVMISLALLFPQEIQPVTRRAQIRFISTLISVVIAAWGVFVLFKQDDPWAYVVPWRASYIYAGIGIMIFFTMLIYRLRESQSQITYTQARIILWGGVVAFTPIGIWFLSQLSLAVPFKPAIFLPFTLVFPIALGICIIRFRLWDIDIIVNRTLVYGSLTITLVIVYYTSVILLENIFVSLTGQSSVIAIVISTLLIAGLFNPLRKRIQRDIDRRFYRSKYQAEKMLEEFGERLRQEVDIDTLEECLLMIVEKSIQPQSESLWLIRTEPVVGPQTSIYRRKNWRKN